jgi:hypothetical protein
MNVLGNHCKLRHEQGFLVYVLSNQETEIAVIPELGGRISSLKDLRTGRDWMWFPIGGPKFFGNAAGDDFFKSPLVGLDECLPNIAPCSWKGRTLPDHGELWAVPWSVENKDWQNGMLRLSVRLNISPFNFTRTLELQENEIRLTYELHNRSSSKELFLWSMHPLLRLQPGDDLELPASTRALLDRNCWVDNLSTAQPEYNCDKLFAGPLSEGWVTVHNHYTGDCLRFEWDVTENNTLGLWLSRGGWHGHHHFALEPANGEPDSLTAAAARNSCGAIAPHATVSWQVSLRVGK